MSNTPPCCRSDSIVAILPSTLELEKVHRASRNLLGFEERYFLNELRGGGDFRQELAKVYWAKHAEILHELP